MFLFYIWISSFIMWHNTIEDIMKELGRLSKTEKYSLFFAIVWLKVNFPPWNLLNSPYKLLPLPPIMKNYREVES